MEPIEEASANVGCENIVERGVPKQVRLDKLYNNYSFIKEVTEWVMLNPDTEHIYTFEMSYPGIDTNDTTAQCSWLKNCLRSLETKEHMNCIIAGSYALWTLSEMIYRGENNWRSNDIDLFILNRAQHARHNPSGGLLDIVHTKETTAVETISNFDIPCCRVAFDMNFTFYVSIHALYSIFTGKVRMPRYLKESKTFISILNKYQKEIPSNRTNVAIDSYHQLLTVRMAERIKKYQSRGFSFQWYDSDYVLPWIKQRFHYVDFETLVQISRFPSTKLVEDKKESKNEKIVRIINLLEKLVMDDKSYLTSLEKHKQELHEMMN